jgi:hypothetical protein
MTRAEAEIRAGRVLPRKATRLEVDVLCMLDATPGIDGPGFGKRYGPTLRMLEQRKLIVWRAVNGKGGWYLNSADD